MKKEKQICSRCKKNKAEITYAGGILDITHGFIEHICQGCYDKIVKNSLWYKRGFKDGIKSVKNEKRKNF